MAAGAGARLGRSGIGAGSPSIARTWASDRTRLMCLDFPGRGSAGALPRVFRVWCRLDGIRDHRSPGRCGDVSKHPMPSFHRAVDGGAGHPFAEGKGIELAEHACAVSELSTATLDQPPAIGEFSGLEQAGGGEEIEVVGESVARHGVELRLAVKSSFDPFDGSEQTSVGRGSAAFEVPLLQVGEE